MTKVVGVTAAWLLVAPGLWAQSLPQIHSRPTVPSAEALARLNLQVGWRVFVPLHGSRDGLFSVQVINGEILVQTRSGGISLIDAASGAPLWRAQVGAPYMVSLPLGYNSRSVFAVNRSYLYAFSRATGQLQWEVALPYSASAAPVADDDQLYLCLANSRLAVYQLPKNGNGHPAGGYVSSMGKAAENQPSERSATVATSESFGVGGRAVVSVGPLGAGRSVNSNYSSGPLTAARRLNDSEATGPRPQLIWEYEPGARLEQAPLLSQDLLTVAGADGSFFTTSKHERREFFRFHTEAPLSAPLGQHGEMAYVASQDHNVYALDVAAAKVRWRFTAGAPVLSKPEVTDEDVYLEPKRVGLYRLRRATGELVWHNRSAERFLANNRKYVYATDRSGRLLVLDRERGTSVGTLDTRDFVVPICNEWTDRLFLASHDGQLLCLHDRQYRSPIRTKTVTVYKNVRDNGNGSRKRPTTP